MLGTWTLAAMIAAAPVTPLEVHTATRDLRSCRALDRDHGGGFVAVGEGGVVFVDADGAAEPPLTAIDGLPETRSYVVEPVVGEAGIWVGTEGGLAKVQGGRVVWQISSAPVRALLQHGGRTFVGTWGDGVFELRDDALTPVAAPAELAGDPLAGRVSDLLVHDGRLLVASAGAGAWGLGLDRDLEGARIIPDLDGLVWSLAVHDGQLYAGTFAGVFAIDDAGVRTVGTQDARDLAEVDGQLLIASHGQGLTSLGSDARPGPASAPSHVRGLDRDRCLATDEGLWIRKGRDWIATVTEGLPSGDISDILQVGDRLFVATFDRGVMVYQDGRWSPISDPTHAIDPQVNALADAGDGSVWIATARGLFRAGGERGTVQAWTKKDGLPHANVISLATRKNGELIVGTHAGVAIVDRDGDLRPLGSKARSWATWALAEADDGSLWIGTTQGLVHWQRDGSWILYSMLSGHLQDNWVTALLVDGDAVHVGTYAAGVTSLRREDDRLHTEQLGGGRINPGGLSLVAGKLHAATMKGLLIHDGRRWQSAAVGLFEDVTAALGRRDGSVWIASRRGLERR